eukprot:31160-Pelagococcus_subviridis.AAC.15
MKLQRAEIVHETVPDENRLRGHDRYELALDVRERRRHARKILRGEPGDVRLVVHDDARGFHERLQQHLPALVDDGDADKRPRVRRRLAHLAVERDEPRREILLDAPPRRSLLHAANPPGGVRRQRAVRLVVRRVRARARRERPRARGWDDGRRRVVVPALPRRASLRPSRPPEVSARDVRPSRARARDVLDERAQDVPVVLGRIVRRALRALLRRLQPRFEVALEGGREGGRD